MKKLVIFRNPKSCFVLAVACASFSAYYALAQSYALPGNANLRERWGSLTTRRGTRGHRTHRARPNGPIDISLLVLATGVMTWKGVSLSRHIRKQQ